MLNTVMNAKLLISIMKDNLKKNQMGSNSILDIE